MFKNYKLRAMKVLITGNMGYVGSVLVKHLRLRYKDWIIIGYDTGFFASHMIESISPECYIDTQYFGDVRDFPEDLLKGVDSIVHLAAVSNDPMGNRYEEATYEINWKASISLAKKGKKAGVKSFVFASSCSIYGLTDELPRKEDSPLNPLTPYAKSKVYTEKGLQNLADENFKVTCLRFATACGSSPRLRLDLVLNDFVASAVASGKIVILSDGTPKRPFIHVKDMARAIEWAIKRDSSCGGDYLVVNVGNQEWNYQIKNLAEKVGTLIPGTEVIINKKGEPDKRSYFVDFSLFKELAPEYQPQYTLEDTVKELKIDLERIKFRDREFRNSNFIRLKVLDFLRENGLIDEKLRWIFKTK